jgi:hypothetical protein
VRFLVSPDANSLPPEIGTFDFVMLSAVYEHLLPEERRRVMPWIWSKLKPGGTLFINQTPYRYFPYEHHTTGLWFINYLPDKLSPVPRSPFLQNQSGCEQIEELERPLASGYSRRDGARNFEKPARDRRARHRSAAKRSGSRGLLAGGHKRSAPANKAGHSRALPDYR